MLKNKQIYIYTHIKLEGKPPHLEAMSVHALGTLFVLMFPWRKSLFFANWERTRIGRITSGIVVVVVVSCFLSCFFLRLVLFFRGARRSVMMFCCVCVASRKFARSFSAPSLFGPLSRQVFLYSSCLGPICWSSGGLPCSFLASWIHEGTYLCQLAPLDYKLGGK